MMCNTAKAVGSIVASYDKVYSREIIERGNISFDDLPVILSDSAFAFERSLIEYRLDAKYKHWLLDEFQDTSSGKFLKISYRKCCRMTPENELRIMLET